MKKKRIYKWISISKFELKIEFTLNEVIKYGNMYVREIFRNDGKITFGFVDTIIYNKIK